MTDDEKPKAPKSLPEWLITRGRYFVTTSEVADLLDLPRQHVSPTLAALRKHNALVSAVRGGYIVNPLEYRSWGAPPPNYFIDAMMQHLGYPYYVGFMSAAELYGSTHQRPQVFQIVTTSRPRRIKVGRTTIELICSRRTSEAGTRTANTPTGTMRVSTPEVTLLDLVDNPNHAAGLSNVATIAGGLLESENINVAQLSRNAMRYPISTVCRTGHILEVVSGIIGGDIDLEILATLVRMRNEPVPLFSRKPRRGHQDHRWNIIVNAELEPDL